MKYGVADYVWFGGNYDLADRLANLKAIGFNGIERLEATDAADAVARAAEFRKLGMDFATVRMGNVAQSILYTAAFGKDYTWLIPGSCGRDVKLDVFVRRTKEFCKACAKYNITAAIHNHLGNTIESQDELDYLMREVPKRHCCWISVTSPVPMAMFLELLKNTMTASPPSTLKTSSSKTKMRKHGPAVCVSVNSAAATSPVLLTGKERRNSSKPKVMTNGSSLNMIPICRIPTQTSKSALMPSKLFWTEL